MLRGLCEEVLGRTTLEYQGQSLDFGAPFARMTLKESILALNPGVALHELEDLASARALASRLDIALDTSMGLGKIQTEIFEKTVESRLMAPTFIMEYPARPSQ